MVLRRRYLRHGADGEPIESPSEMFWRVATVVSAPDAQYGDDPAQAARAFYEILTSFRFMPNSPTFTGAGTPWTAGCLLCAAHPRRHGPRSCRHILHTARGSPDPADRGGNGFSFSRLRPKGARVSTSKGLATGPVGFLRVYDKAFGEIAQGGTRRGANMAVLRVDHPDILDFVRCKGDEGDITNFNISVGITDAFMLAVESDEEYDLISPQDGSVWKRTRAREVFDEIVRYAHRNGEPGVLFLDTANRSNPRRTSTSSRQPTPAASSGSAPMRTAASDPSTWQNTQRQRIPSTGHSYKKRLSWPPASSTMWWMQTGTFPPYRRWRRQRAGPGALAWESWGSAT